MAFSIIAIDDGGTGRIQWIKQTTVVHSETTTTINLTLTEREREAEHWPSYRDVMNFVDMLRRLQTRRLFSIQDIPEEDDDR